jgi:hypothetical protein
MPAQRDLAIPEVIHLLRHGDREVCELLHVVDELLVARAIDRARLVGQPVRGLASLPLAPVDEHHLAAAVFRHHPVADERQKVRRFDADRFAVDADAHGALSTPHHRSEQRTDDAGGLSKRTKSQHQGSSSEEEEGPRERRQASSTRSGHTT